MSRITVVLSSLFLIISCGDDGAALGEPCEAAGECASGLCEPTGTGWTCTDNCASSAECVPTIDGGRRVCGGEGVCIDPCTDGNYGEAGGQPAVCIDGVFVACATADETYCGACGCDLFGGGVCIDGNRCVAPRADGEGCTVDEECQSELCYRDSSVCGPPRPDGETCSQDLECMSALCYPSSSTCGPPKADGETCASASECASNSCLSDGRCGPPRPMGEPCSVDADCADQNCSTDGDADRTGSCNQPLGSACEFGDSTCTRCIRPNSFGSGICSRRGCDPTTAPNCPATSERRWTCERTTEGGHACFETCADSGIYLCYEGSDICIDGFCQ